MRNRGRSSFHICLYVPSLRGGGAERAMVNLANGFSKRGYDVSLMVSELGVNEKFIDKNVSLINLSRKKVSASVIPAIMKLRQMKPDIFMTTLVHANLLFSLTRFFLPRSTKLILREASTPSRLSHQNFRLKTRLMPKLIKIYNNADKIVAVSDGVKSDLVNLGVSQNKIFVAASPSIPEDILSLSMAAAPHPWLEEANPVIIAMGRLVRDKGFDTLVKAFALVRHDLPAKLIILGEGPMRKELLKLAVEYEVEKFVDFPGFSENPFPYIRMCDLFVLSSRREGSPNVLIQALFLKAKVVATDCPSGPSEILTEEMSNYLVPPEDVEVMANRICQALRTVQPTVGVEKFTVDAASVKYLHIFSA